MKPGTRCECWDQECPNVHPIGHHCGYEGQCVDDAVCMVTVRPERPMHVPVGDGPGIAIPSELRIPMCAPCRDYHNLHAETTWPKSLQEHEKDFDDKEGA